ncbi:MAG: T9SS type A sorting domain-containing protein [Flavobacteriales bacterium]|nr:T9SS type A sorting domain-containing protein [Flavobacteriales bacterium]
MKRKLLIFNILLLSLIGAKPISAQNSISGDASINTPTSVTGSLAGINCLQKVGNYLFTGYSSSSNIDVFDLSDPSVPTLINTQSLESPFTTSCSFLGMTEANGYLFVVSGTSNKLYIVDVSNPSSLNVVGSVALPQLSADVVVDGNYAYIATVDGGGPLTIVDISTMSAPTVVSQLSFGTGAGSYYNYQVEKYGNYVFLNYFNNGGLYELKVVDVTNPAVPTIANNSAAGVTTIWGDFETNGNALYLSYNNGGVITLRTLDITNPASPVFSSDVAISGTADGMNYDGQYLFLTCNVNSGGVGSLTVLDVTDPLNPIKIAESATSIHSATEDVFVVPGYAYKADPGTGEILVFRLGCMDEQTVSITDANLCATNTGTVVNLGSSEIGIDYYLRDDANNAVLDGPVAGTGSSITFNTGVVSGATTYNVFGQTTDLSCSYEMIQKVSVTISDVVAPNAICKNTIANLDASGNATILASDIDNGSYDDCSSTVTLGASSLTFSCSDLGTGTPSAEFALMITGIYDGPISGNPKGVELYVAHDIADLSLYGLGSANNGGGTDGQEFTFPSVSVTAGTFLYISSESTQFTNFFGFAPDYFTGAMAINGDDAVELFYNGNVVDVFGDINASGTGTPWEYLDGWAYRKSSSGPDGATFQVNDWNFSGINQLELGTTNPTCTSPFPLGSYTHVTTQGFVPVTLTVTDPSSNSSTCVATVIVVDNMAPTPVNATLSDLNDNCSVSAATAPTANDNCGGTITGVSDVTFPVTSQGTTLVTWTFDDGNGNSITQTQNVIIDDVTAPVADATTLSDLTGECSVAAPTAPTATDNCVGTITGVANVTFPITSQGTTVVTWTFDDGNGNSITQTQNVIIDDVTPPVADATVLTDLTDECSVTAPTAPTATDNCGGTITGVANVTFPITAQGTTLVTWTFDDGNGNSITQTQNVIIDDVTPPTITAPTDIIVAANSTGCTATGVSLGSETTSDNCSGAVTVSNNAPTIFPEGITTVTWTATDAAGNSSTSTQTVEVVNGVGVSGSTSISVTDVNCNGGNDGSIDITQTGGVTPISFSWTGPSGYTSADEDPSNLIAGGYSATITDAIGCFITGTITVNEPTAITISINQTNPSTCGIGNGSIDATVAGGVPSYGFEWDNSEVTEDISGLSAGVYVLTVTDAHNCISMSTVTLVDPAAPIVVVDSVHHVSCHGIMDGEIFTTVSGGSTPYTYDWDNDGIGDLDDLEDVSSLGGGIFNLFLSDAAGCTALASATVIEPDAISVSSASTDVLCFGGSTGTATLTSSGGTGVLTESWGGEDPAALSMGTYTYTVTDDNGCVATGSVSISEPTELTLNITGNDEINGNDGSVDLTVSGGTSPYDYIWNNSEITEDLSGLTAGTYSVNVTDDNGCNSSTSITINSQVSIFELNGISVNVYPNPSNGLIYVQLNELIEGEIEVYDALGKMVMNQPLLSLNTSIDLSTQEGGLYLIKIRSGESVKVMNVVLQ